MGNEQDSNIFKRRMQANINDIIVGAIALLAGLFLWFVFIPETVVIRGEVHYFFRNPQFVPRLWTMFIIISSIMVIVEAIFLNPLDENKIYNKINIWAILSEFYLAPLLLIIMVGFVLLVPRIGYLPATTIGFIASLVCFGYYRLRYIVILGAIVPFGMYYFFTELLNVYIR